jgi:hypothetical protein
LCVTTFLACAMNPADGLDTAAGPRCHLRVHVIDAVPVGPVAVDVARREVERIWAPGGLTFEWRAGPPAPATGHPGVVVAALSRARGPRAHGDVAWWAGTTLGTAGFADPVRPLSVLRILVSREGLVDLARINGRPASEWPLVAQHHLVGRAVGRVLAHELGHYLLASRQHSPRGLMRASFSINELQGPDVGPFLLDAPHAALLSTSWLEVTACRPDLAAERR